MFDSNFLCAACDKHWEQHDTFFETEDMRRREGLPVGKCTMSLIVLCSIFLISSQHVLK